MTKLQRWVAVVVLALFILSIVPTALAAPPEKHEKPAKPQRVQQMREDLQEQEQKQKEIREDVQEKKEKLAMLSKQVRACKKEECASKKTELKKGVKEHLAKLQELIAHSIENIRDRIESSQALTVEEKEELLTQLEEQQKALEGMATKNTALSENATSSEYKAAIKDLKDEWHKVKKVQQKAIAALISSKMEHLVEKVSVDYVKKLQGKRDELKTAGKDVSNLDNILAQYKQKAESISQLQKQAKELILKGDFAGYKEAQQKIRTSIGEIKKMLRSFLEEYRQLKKSPFDSSNETAVPTPPAQSNETAPVNETTPPTPPATGNETAPVNETPPAAAQS